MQSSDSKSGKTEYNNWSYGKWVADNTSAMYDVCNKQMKDILSFYNNIFRFYEEHKAIDNKEDAYSWMNWGMKNWNALLSPIDAMYKNGKIWEDFNANYGNMWQRLSELNKEFFGSVYKQLENDESDMDNMRTSWVGFTEGQMEQSKKFMSMMNDAFQKRMEFNSQLLKSMLKTMNHQSHLMNDKSVKIFDEISKILKQEETEVKKEKSSVKPKETLPEKKVPVY